MKRIFQLLLVILITLPVISTADDSLLAEYYQNQISDVQVRGSGVVIKLLLDDNEGSRHQKFILQLNSGQTLLVSHNIDLAPRIDSLNVKDVVEFYGEYEWNSKGGVVHWTHIDPRERHKHGWLLHNGNKYQ